MINLIEKFEDIFKPSEEQKNIAKYKMEGTYDYFLKKIYKLDSTIVDDLEDLLPNSVQKLLTLIDTNIDKKEKLSIAYSALESGIVTPDEFLEEEEVYHLHDTYDMQGTDVYHYLSFENTDEVLEALIEHPFYEILKVFEDSDIDVLEYRQECLEKTITDLYQKSTDYDITVDDSELRYQIGLSDEEAIAIGKELAND